MKIQMNRLLIELPDGTFKVVGFEKLEGGKIWHQPIEEDPDAKPFPFFDILQVDNFGNHCYYIEHSRRDRCLHTTSAGGNYFERDRIRSYEGHTGTIIYDTYNTGYYCIYDQCENLDWGSKKFGEIIGIEGVTNKKLDT